MRQRFRNSMVIVATERLILRHFCLLDAEAMDRVFGDAEVMYYGDAVKTPQWVREWLTLFGERL